MAESSIPVEQDEFSCPVCLDYFNYPVTVPCGHNFCMTCIRCLWDREDGSGIYHCPQCRKTFESRPVLGKNILLANMVEERKQCRPGPETVWCDVCPRGMQLAEKSCLRCVASYCKAHLKPHYESSALLEHQLIESTAHLRSLVCEVHREPLKVYCRTDQQCVCLLCAMDKHKHHDTVSAAAERTERQKSLCSAQENSQNLIQNKEKKLLDTKQAVHLLLHTARTALEESERVFADIIRYIEGQRSKVKELILCEERDALVRAKGLKDRLEQEITRLKRRDAEFQKLAQTEDHVCFLQRWRCLSAHPDLWNIPEVTADPDLNFESVRKAVSELRDQLKTFCLAEFDKLSEKVNKVTAPPSRKHRARAESSSTATSRAEVQNLRSGQTESGYGPPAAKVQILASPKSLPEPRTREEFLRYACKLTLDPNTAHAKLLLSDRDREATWVKEKLGYPNVPERFDYKCQVLCREALSGRRCYWEAEVKGNKAEIAVAYEALKRKGGGRGTSFGGNDKSWSLDCINGVYSICHNNNGIKLPTPYFSKVGVYLDHPAGTLSFYGVSDIMTLIHRVETKFTEPVYAGFWIGEQCRVKLLALAHHPNAPRRTTL